jgi:sarcosine oxidase subunit gamma
MVDAPMAPANGVEIARSPAFARFVLRGRGLVSEATLAAFGAPRPAASCGPGWALHLGPDEWWLLLPAAEQGATLARLTAALGALPHSLVDIGDRQAAFRIHGPRATTLLAAFCPLDLDPLVFPVGACTRTLLGKAGMMLWRTSDDAFHLEVGRSVAGYAMDLLALEARQTG